MGGGKFFRFAGLRLESKLAYWCAFERGEVCASPDTIVSFIRRLENFLRHFEIEKFGFLRNFPDISTVSGQAQHHEIYRNTYVVFVPFKLFP